MISYNVPRWKQTHRERVISFDPVGTCPGDQIFSARIFLIFSYGLYLEASRLWN